LENRSPSVWPVQEECRAESQRDPGYRDLRNDRVLTGRSPDAVTVILAQTAASGHRLSALRPAASALLAGSCGITIVRIPDQVLCQLRRFRLLAADNLEDFSR
jgi:hypothetical protein